MGRREDDRRVLVAAVREAGALALRHFEAGVESWEKKPGDPVTEADLAVDALLRRRLAGARPDYAWLSEESEDDLARLDRRRVWVVDPIDGTRAFVKRRPQFAVCAALVEDGRAVLGAVFNPATDEMFEASAGGGAFLNGEPIKTTNKKGLAQARLLASRRTFENREWIELAPGADFTSMNSIAYRMALVAAGRFDATVSLSPKSDWDIAAADLVVHEAGGICTSAGGGEFGYNRRSTRHASVIAAGPALHAELVALLGRR